MTMSHVGAEGGALVCYLRRIFERRLAQGREEKTT